MERRVVITGAGVLSSLGDSPLALFAALCEGRSGVHPIESFSTDGLACRQAGELRAFTPELYLGERNLRPLDRTSRLVTAAAKLALDDSGWSAELRRRCEVGVVLGTMFCSVHTISEFDRRGLVLGPKYVSPMDFANTVINAAAGQVAIWHDLRGVNSTIAGGITSGLQAIAYATELIRSGQAAAILTGGAEELCFESFHGFGRAGLLCAPTDGVGECPIPFDARRNGFALGEGAALLMLEDAESAAARGASVLAEVKGYGSAYDLSRGTAPAKAVEATARAMRLALRDARMRADDIDCLSASANGSVPADRYEAQAVAAVFAERAPSLPVTAIKSMLGETLGASGAMQTVVLLAAMREGVLPGIRHLEHTEADFPLAMASPHNHQLNLRNGLINAVGLDGNCCAMVVARSDDF
jgi:3-oxoacyl-[acyl-carrier-protein] synthase II